MDQAAQQMFSALAQRFHHSPAESLLRFLPEDKQTFDSSNPGLSSVPSLISAKQLLDLHYSWLEPSLSQFEEEQQNLFSGCLTQRQQLGLSKLWNRPLNNKAISNEIQTHLLKKLYEKIEFAPIPPKESIPQNSPYTQLLQLDKNHLVELIDFLGLFDLAVEIKRTVNRTSLKPIYLWLSEKHQTFLRTCLRQSTIITGPRQDIHTWAKSEKEFKRLLHTHGLTRFAIVLSKEHPALLWHLIHTLDKGRGSIINKVMQQTHSEELISSIHKQFFNLYQFLQNHG